MRIVMAANSAWNLANFRGGLIRALIDRGDAVTAFAPPDASADRLRAMGCAYVPIAVDNAGLSPARDLTLLAQMWRDLRRVHPDVFLGFTVKPNVYGSMAAHALGIPVISTISGLGTAFIADSWLTWLVEGLYRPALSRAHTVFFQNPEDCTHFVSRLIVSASKVARLPGSGVDLSHFAPVPLPEVAPGEFRFLMVARLLWDKGVGEYVEAARIVRQTLPGARFQLLGPVDTKNRTAVDRATLDSWVREGLIEYLGEADDVRPFIAASDCVVLPSYREGTPKALIEAAAMARPIIASDVPGCREVVRDGLNGFLCLAYDAEALAQQMLRMARLTRSERAAMGEAGRRLAEANFDERIVIARYIAVLDGLRRDRQGIAAAPEATVAAVTMLDLPVTETGTRRMIDIDQATIAVIGLGYVGLPLAVEFGQRRKVVGFDLKVRRIEELRRGEDATREVEGAALKASADRLVFTHDERDLNQCGIFIIAVPTPIDRANRPDLSLLCRASETVARRMKRGAVVIYESTVYPGCTRETCVPILEKISGLALNDGFFVGYSPERANPGDRAHRLTTIVKVTSGSSPEASEAVDRLYRSIVPAGTHPVPSIETAEAAKVIENTQRDLNIALMNELAIIFNRLGLDTLEVLEAAETKWNFLPFRPGLVGGHCIGVDPYYLTHRAQEVGYHSEVILAGRRINDGMGRHVADRVARLMMRRGFPVVGSRILMLGVAFKENCPDLRNSKAVDIARELQQLNAQVDIYDPWVSSEACREEFGLACLDQPLQPGRYDGIIVAVGHREFAETGAAGIRMFGRDGAVLFDVKGLFPKTASDGRL